MKKAQILYGWLVLALVGVGVVGAVVTNYLPEAGGGFSNQVADGLVFSSLYAGIFLIVLGLAAIVDYIVRWTTVRSMYPIARWEVVRQASLFAVGVTSVLALRGYHVFSWWDAALLGAALVLVELSFHVKRAAE